MNRPVDKLVSKPIGWERFEQLLSYYLDCIREDESQGARFFLKDEGNRFLSLQLDKEWNLKETSTLDVALESKQSNFGKQLLQRKSTGALLYGYPLYLDWLERSKKGWSGGFAVPVFLQTAEYMQKGSDLNLRLTPEWPRLNPEFLNAVCSSPEEKRSFLQDLGLQEIEEAFPADGLAKLVLRLTKSGLPIDCIEPLEPSRLTIDPQIGTLTQKGLYNRALLIIGEKSKFTAGLEHELERLRERINKEDLARTALSNFFAPENMHMQTTEAQTEVPLVEVVPLNEEQRQAVNAAFKNPLTVVTGPPGTGKSQVVVTVLANAYLRGERVLFTSRNHKAVSVVENRINGLSDYPLVVRAGTRSGERNFRGELLKFISQVLSASVTDIDKRAEQEARSTVQHLQERRQFLWKRLEEVREARNLVDRLDQILDGPREKLPKLIWESIFKLDAFPDIGMPEEALHMVDFYLKEKLGFIKRLGRSIQRGNNFKKFEHWVKPLANHPCIFGKLPDLPLTEGNLETWGQALHTAVERVNTIKNFLSYRQTLETLKQLPSPEDFAVELAEIEERLWYWGSRLIAAHGRLLPQRLTGEIRRTLGEFRATIERLAEDYAGGKIYGQLMREQERLFANVSNVLPIWCVTNLSARGTIPFESALFDLVVIDEASQCDIPSAIPLLFRAKRIMIIGDPNQLNHISILQPSRDQQLQAQHRLATAADQPFTYIKNSLFDLAVTCAGQTKVIMLQEHFRSHADIINFSNQYWYRTLRISTDYRRLVNLDGIPQGICWTPINGNIIRPLNGGAINIEEAQAVVDQLETLLVRKKFRGSVGIVTPFRAQANRIRELVNARIELSAIEQSELIIDTAHGFQGDERDVIFFSPCVAREMPRGAQYFLSSTGNLFNVAITRARALLHVVGDIAACSECGVRHIEEFAAYVAQLEDKKPHFSKGRVEFADPKVGYWERPFYEALVAAGIKPMPQYLEHQYVLDLAIVEGNLRLDIETDGKYYHQEWDSSRCRGDVIRDLRLATLGWNVKRFWTYRIRDEMEACVQEILSLLEEAKKASR